MIEAVSNPSISYSCLAQKYSPFSLHNLFSSPFVYLDLISRPSHKSLLNLHLFSESQFSAINMKLSVLSSAALLTSGFLVFGRPLITRRDPTFLYNPDVDGFPTDLYTTIDIPEPGDTHTIIQDTHPITQLDTAFGSGTPNTSPSFLKAMLDGQTNFNTFSSPVPHDTPKALPKDPVYDNPWELYTLPSIANTFKSGYLNPENFQQDLQRIDTGNAVYCIYLLQAAPQNSIKQVQLKLKNNHCGSSSDWNVFANDFDGLSSGAIAIYRTPSDKILSIMKVRKDCREMVMMQGASSYNLLPYGRQDKETLEKFTD